jgi:hypothetical protein
MYATPEMKYKIYQDTLIPAEFAGEETEAETQVEAPAGSYERNQSSKTDHRPRDGSGLDFRLGDVFVCHWITRPDSRAREDSR